MGKWDAETYRLLATLNLFFPFKTWGDTRPYSVQPGKVTIKCYSMASSPEE
ncbi:hypothetical protein BvCmsK106A_01319 [Escherichia coli]|nr:hypothetical protein BvCmsK106A_01319 [Escherichia coli]